MPEPKPWYASKTIWGGIIAAASALLGALGVQVSPEDQSSLVSGLAAAGGGVGLLLTVVGRITARRPIERRGGLRIWPLLLALALSLPAVGCASRQEKLDYYNAQVAARQMAKPLLYLKAKPGEEIVLKGVEEMAVYSPHHEGIPQYRDEWANVAVNGVGVLGTVAGIYLGGQVAVDLATAVGQSAGTHISNSFNPSGAQSAAGYSGSGTVTPTITDRHDISNSYNDSHDTTNSP